MAVSLQLYVDMSFNFQVSLFQEDEDNSRLHFRCLPISGSLSWYFVPFLGFDCENKVFPPPLIFAACPHSKMHNAKDGVGLWPSSLLSAFFLHHRYAVTLAPMVVWTTWLHVMFSLYFLIPVGQYFYVLKLEVQSVATAISDAGAGHPAELGYQGLSADTSVWDWWSGSARLPLFCRCTDSILGLDRTDKTRAHTMDTPMKGRWEWLREKVASMSWWTCMTIHRTQWHCVV